MLVAMSEDVPAPKLVGIVKRLIQIACPAEKAEIAQQWDIACERQAKEAIDTILSTDPNFESAPDDYDEAASAFRAVKGVILSAARRRDLQAHFKRAGNRLFSRRSRTMKKQRHETRDAELAEARARIGVLEQTIRDMQAEQAEMMLYLMHR